MINQVLFDGRALISKGVVVAVKDDGQAQLVDVLTYDAGLYSDVEVWQPSGFASVPPADGVLAMVFAIGGDAGHRMAFLYNPSVRFGGMKPGESVMYGDDGSRVGVRNGGTVEVYAMALVDVQSPAVSIKAPHGVSILGDVMLAGNLHVTEGLRVDGTVTGDTDGTSIFHVSTPMRVDGATTLVGATTVTADLTVTGTIHGHF